MRSKVVGVLSGIAALTLILAPMKTFSCGPFIRTSVFSYDYHPDLPFQKYAAGELGAVPKTYARSYLVVAYRTLINKPLSTEEQKSFDKVWTERTSYSNVESEEADKQSTEWLKLRAKISGLAKIDEIGHDRDSGSGSDDGYDSYLNCPKGAFINAVSILKNKQAKFGAESTQVKDWVKAQDDVFCHCSGPAYDYSKKTAPAEGPFPQLAPASADATAKADRAYQLASANFYAQKYDDAISQFDAIGKDSNSPYAQIAPYLAARAVIRKAVVRKIADHKILADAQNRLHALMHDHNFDSMHDQILALLDYVAARLEPTNRLVVLSNQLTGTEKSRNIAQSLTDYTLLLDKYLGDFDPYDVDQDRDTHKQVQFPKSALTEMTEWIIAYQNADSSVLASATDKWLKTHDALWLLPVIVNAKATNPHFQDLVNAAEKLQPDSPAYLTANLNAVRLLHEAGKENLVKQRIEAIMTETKGKMPPSTLSNFCEYRMATASSLKDYLKDGLRACVAEMLDMEVTGQQFPDDKYVKTQKDGYESGAVLFDDNAVAVLNKLVPLSMLEEVAKTDMPKGTHLNAVQAVWVRAALLGNDRVTSDLTPLFASLQPSIKSLLTEYAAAKDPAQKQFLLAYLLLKNPGARPFIRGGSLRETPFSNLDDFQDNWWCVDDKPDTTTASPKLVSPPFITAGNAADAKSEFQKLHQIGSGTTFMLSKTIAWAQSHQTDPKLPEALSIAIKTPKFGCTDKQSTALSKTAYTILHKNYPANPFTKKTKFWY